jgi:hypothetical protein
LKGDLSILERQEFYPEKAQQRELFDIAFKSQEEYGHKNWYSSLHSANKSLFP